MNEIQLPTVLSALFDYSEDKLWTYVDKECVSKLISELDNLTQELIEKCRHNQEIEIHVKDHIQWCNAKYCHICFVVIFLS